MIEDGVHPAWVKSTFCNADGCIEVATIGSDRWVRDSKLGDASPILKFDEEEWLAFSRGVVAGEF